MRLGPLEEVLRGVHITGAGRQLARPLTEADRDDTTEDERATEQLDRPRQLAEQDPGEQDCEEHLGQSDKLASVEPRRRAPTMART